MMNLNKNTVVVPKHLIFLKLGVLNMVLVVEVIKNHMGIYILKAQ